ncbi:MAG: hypothetical protein V8R80_07455 [Eubacterium sp.]
MNRWVYAIIGVIVLLLAGSVMPAVMSGPTPGPIPVGRTAVSDIHTGYGIVLYSACLAVGSLAKKVSPKIYVALSGVLFFSRIPDLLFISPCESPVLLYLGFGLVTWCGLAYNAVMSTMSAWFPDKQGLISVSC